MVDMFDAAWTALTLRSPLRRLRRVNDMTDEALNSSQTAGWTGRFPFNPIITLLDVDRRHNLAESTSQNARLGELLDLVDIESLRKLPLGYGSAQGAVALREAVGALTGVPPEAVLSTQGTALGLFLLAFEVCRSGEVVLTTPCFPPARDTLAACGARVREVRLNFDDGYRIDVERIVDALTPTTRLVSVASPQNPSGVGTSLGTFARLLDAMLQRAPDALLFVDETYREAAYEGIPPPSAASLDPRVVTGGSVSKAHGAPGLRVGWLTVPDSDLRQRLMIAKMNTTLSGSPLDEALATVVIQNRETFLEPRRRMLAQALAILRPWLAREKARLDWVEPDGGALCCVRLREAVFDESAVSRFWAGLAQNDLQLASGEWFGERSRVFRLGFGYLPLDRLAPALDAISTCLDGAAGRD